MLVRISKINDSVLQSNKKRVEPPNLLHQIFTFFTCAELVGALPLFVNVCGQTLIKRHPAERGAVTYNYKFHARTRDGDIHSAQVAQETYVSFLVRAHKADDDDIPLLSLEAIDGVYGDERAEWLPVFVLS